MDHQDRQAIEQLFGKIAQVEGQAGAPDARAAEFIRSQIARQPNAPYYMAQTIVVQEQALSAAQGRIQQLEHELASRPAGGGGFLSSLLQFAISIIGVLVFTGLTAYDTQTIKEQYAEGFGHEANNKMAVFGALSLYLNFVNIFQLLLSLTGQREE